VVAIGLASLLGPTVVDKPVEGAHDQLNSFTIDPWIAMVAGTPAQILTVSLYGVQIGGGAPAEPG